MVRLVYSFSNIAELVAFALETLRELSPVGSTGDEHPGLYRDSHTIFLNGHVVNRGKNIRFTDPEDPIPALPLTCGRIALEIEAAEIEFRKVEIKSLGDGSDAGK